MSEPTESLSLLNGNRWFPTTRWSVVLNASQPESATRQQALEDLCRSYWYPLYACARQHGFAPEEAQDLTQDFFVRCLEENTLAVVDPAKGRFRTFLRVAMTHHLSHARERAAAGRRGGGRTPLSLDEEGIELRFLNESAESGSPEMVFDRRWALTLLDAALTRLGAGYRQTGKGELFDILKPFLEGHTGQGECQEAGQQLRLSPNAVAVAVYRLRQRYRDLIRAEVAQTVAHPADVEDEMRTLLEALR